MTPTDALLPATAARSDDASVRARIEADDKEEARIKRGRAAAGLLAPQKQQPLPAIAAALLAIALLVGMLAAGTLGPAPPPEPAACQDQLIDGVCWLLSAEGETCSEACGSGSAVDAEATVRGSGEAQVQRALAPDAAIGGIGCGVDTLRFPYGGQAMLDAATSTWECRTDASFVHAGPAHRSACVCVAPPTVHVVRAAARGALIGPGIAASLLGLAAAIDVLLPAPPPTAAQLDPLKPEPMSAFKRSTTALGALAIVFDVVSDVAVIIGYAGSGDWAFFYVAAAVLALACVVNAAIAASAFYPAIDGLDFGSIEEVEAEALRRNYGANVARRMASGGFPKGLLLQLGVYRRRVPPWAAALLGLVGLATPVQGVFDAWRGRQTVGFGDMKVRALSGQIVCTLLRPLPHTPRLTRKRRVCTGAGGARRVGTAAVHCALVDDDFGPPPHPRHAASQDGLGRLVLVNVRALSNGLTPLPMDLLTLRLHTQARLWPRLGVVQPTLTRSPPLLRKRVQHKARARRVAPLCTFGRRAARRGHLGGGRRHERAAGVRPARHCLRRNPRWAVPRQRRVGRLGACVHRRPLPAARAARRSRGELAPLADGRVRLDDALPRDRLGRSLCTGAAAAPHGSSLCKPPRRPPRRRRRVQARRLSDVRLALARGRRAAVVARGGG